MNENKLSDEIAEQELHNWLERNNISESKIEAFADSCKVIKDAFKKGFLVLNENGTLTQKLESPIGSQTSPITELVFNARVNRKMVMPHLNGVKNDNGDGRILAYMAAGTGKVKTILAELMPEDQSIADNITLFFMN
jgi:hypothetical protein